jgi:hypothetical protein
MKISKLQASLASIALLAVLVLGWRMTSTEEQSSAGAVVQQHGTTDATTVTDENTATQPSDRGAASGQAETANANDASAADAPHASESSADSSVEQRSPADFTAPGASPQEKVEQLKRLEGLIVNKIGELETGLQGETDETSRAGYRQTIEANKRALASTREQLAAAEKEIAASQ